jgi:hypothetical protein
VSLSCPTTSLRSAITRAAESSRLWKRPLRPSWRGRLRNNPESAGRPKSFTARPALVCPWGRWAATERSVSRKPRRDVHLFAGLFLNVSEVC